MLKCKVCGAAVSPDSSVCSECGASIRANRKQGTKKRRSRNNNHREKKSAPEEIFSTSERPEKAVGSENAIKDVFSSEEAYEKMRKGNVLEKIHDLEEKIGDTSEVEDEPFPTIVPTVINRTTTNDIIRSAEGSSRRDGKHNIPKRVIHSVTKPDVGNKLENKQYNIKKKATSEQKQPDSAEENNNVRIKSLKENPTEIFDKPIIDEKNNVSSDGEKAGQDNYNKGYNKKKNKKYSGEKKKDSAVSSDGSVKNDCPKRKSEPAAAMNASESVSRKASEVSETSRNQRKSRPEKKGTEASSETDEGLKKRRPAEESSDQSKKTDNILKPKNRENKRENNKENKRENNQETKQKTKQENKKPTENGEASAKKNDLEESVISIEKSDSDKKNGVKNKKNSDSGKNRKKQPNKAKSSDKSEVIPARETVSESENRNDTNEEVSVKTEKGAEKKSDSAPVKKKKRKKPEQNVIAAEDESKAKKTKPERTENKSVESSEKQNRKKEHKKEDRQPRFSDSDIEENKYLAALSYLGVLIILPFFKVEESDFCKAHVRQGAAVFVYSIILELITLAAVLGLRALILWTLGWNVLIYNILALAVAAVMLTLIFIPVFSGAVAAFSGTYKKVPFVGKSLKK